MASATKSINDVSSVKKKEDPKPSPINKYSIYEMKAAIDGQIMEYLEKNEFVEDNLNTNLKIVFGTFCIFWTGMAYFYPKPFPENFSISVVSLVMYMIGSSLYYYVEKFMIKQTFYTGIGEKYVQNLRQGNKEKLKAIKLSSEIKDYDHLYQMWIEFVTLEGRIVKSEIFKLDCTKVCDEKGYVNRDLVFQQFKKIFDEELTHKLI